MAAHTDKRNEMMAKISGLMESGFNPEQIAKSLQEEVAEKTRIDIEGPDHDTIPNTIRVIAQALAFRNATEEDFSTILQILREAYRAEVDGSESFRSGEIVDTEGLHDLFADSTYRWLVVEAPNGHGYEDDGVILGVCCFSVDGVSRKNGEIEGRLGSVRFLAVANRFCGLCVGMRLLKRAEAEMMESSCCRSMICIPSTRSSMSAWAKRKGYSMVNSMKYPSGLGHSLQIPTVELQVYTKRLEQIMKLMEDLPPKSGKGGLSLPLHWRQARREEENVESSIVRVTDAAEPKSTTEEDCAFDVPDVD